MVSKTPATIRMTKPSAPISFKSIIKGSKDHSKGRFFKFTFLIQIPTRIPEKIVVALSSGILVVGGIASVLQDQKLTLLKMSRNDPAYQTLSKTSRKVDSEKITISTYTLIVNWSKFLIQ